MKRVLSANLLKYNANTAGNRSPDCVKRAISYAFDKSYIKVGKDLNAMMKNLRWSKWNVPMVYEPVIQSYGGSVKYTPDRFDKDFSYGTTLNEFADKYNSGSYVIAVGPDGSSKRSNHLVAAVNGEVIDSWDSREMFIKGIYKTNHEHQVKTDLWSSNNVAKLRELCVSECTKNVINFQNKLIAKYGWQIEQPGDGLAEIDAYVRNYQIVVAIFFKVKWGEGKENRIWLDRDVNFVFTPTTSMEKAESYIRTTAYTRLYDRFYELTKQVLNKIEENEAKLDIASKMGPDAANEPSYLKYVDGRERAFYNSLPGQYRSYVNTIRITNPGQEHDSYIVKLIPKYGRANSFDGKYVRLEAFNAKDMREMIDTYMQSGKIADVDYEFY